MYTTLPEDGYNMITLGVSEPRFMVSKMMFSGVRGAGGVKTLPLLKWRGHSPQLFKVRDVTNIAN